MATTLDFLEYVKEFLTEKDGFTYRMMMGEYLIYKNGLLCGGISDNRVFIKDTIAGRKFVKNYILAPMYTGAKPSLLIENIEDRAFMIALADLTIVALQENSNKKKRKKEIVLV